MTAVGWVRLRSLPWRATPRSSWEPPPRLEQRACGRRWGLYGSICWKWHMRNPSDPIMYPEFCIILPVHDFEASQTCACDVPIWLARPVGTFWWIKLSKWPISTQDFDLLCLSPDGASAPLEVFFPCFWRIFQKHMGNPSRAEGTSKRNQFWVIFHVQNFQMIHPVESFPASPALLAWTQLLPRQKSKSCSQGSQGSKVIYENIENKSNDNSNKTASKHVPNDR